MRPIIDHSRIIMASRVSLIALLVVPIAAQTAPAAAAVAADDTGIDDIIVTAQRASQSLQDVPIAVTAFTGEGLEKQQINTASDLQLTLPNITFSKNNFTNSSFTIRGIGDLCTGATCDYATAIHINDVPLLSTRLFETENLDLERVEVLRGPQGTLFGRNATAGVINFITAKPDLTAFGASTQGEYGNFDSYKLRATVNAPITDKIGVRVAGIYQKRDGFTKNLFDNGRIDGRDLYAIRGSLRLAPTDRTRIDLLAYYFREKDDRSRIQKQLCHRDPTGILGCLPDRLENGVANADATLANIWTSREFLSFAASPAFAPYALGGLDGIDTYSVTNPTDVRTVRVDYTPTYLTTEQQYLGRLEQEFDSLKLTVSGGYTVNDVDSTTDYNLAVQDSIAGNPGLLALAGAAAAPGAAFPGGINPFTPLAAAVIPNGPNGNICQSAPQPGLGLYAGDKICAPQGVDVDRSNIRSTQWTAEAHLDSQFDGAFNFLVGGIYVDSKSFDNSYYVTNFGLDYSAGLLGVATALGARTAGATFPNVFLATPFFRNDTQLVKLKSYGLFGEAYVDISDRLKLTVGGRYNHDEKSVRARATLQYDTGSRQLLNASGGALRDAEGNTIAISAPNSVLVPYGATSITQALNYAALDYDPFNAGLQEFATARVSFGRVTGRAVLDFKITDENLLYASYSRGYKSGGINPPLSPVFAVAQSFDPETVNAFEVGSKNTFLDGTLRLNLTAFYYQYKQLQLSRIVARTAVNDNVNANIYGFELEAIVRPSRRLLINFGASYLKSKVSSDKFLGNPQDPSGGRTDAVIIKDITNASNCAVRPTTVGNAAGTRAFVSTINTAALGLRPTQVVLPDSGTHGAFSVCGVLAAAAAGNIAAYNPALGALQPLLNFNFNGGSTGPLPYVVDPSGVLVNIKGNQLPQAPAYKFSAGIQYTADFANGMSFVPRVDLAYTGGYAGSIFNQPINRIQGYEVVNAQLQLNGAEERWFVRGFVQNLTRNNATTGQYVTDQSSGLFTNIFTLEPRRYGVAVGAKF